MRILKISTIRLASGVLSDGTNAPALPQVQAVLLERVTGVSLTVQINPPATSGQPPLVVAQVISAQLDNGSAIPIARNLSPGDTTKQAAIRDLYDGPANGVLTKVKDDTIPEIALTYQEL